MLVLLAAHAVAAVVLLVLGSRLGRWAKPVAVAAPLATLVWAFLNTSAVLDGTTISASYTWVEALNLNVRILVDGFALLMVFLISGVGLLVLAYTWAYMGDNDRTPSFTGLLVLFAGAMLGIVTADNLLFLFVFWEITSIASFLLIGFQDEKATARSAAVQALLVTGGGGLAMLAGIVLISMEANTLYLSQILSDPPTTPIAAAGAALILLGAFTKSAQVPFHFWLPGAMAAPTPVSAYLHSATMVKAGIYLIARLSPAFAVVFGWWIPVVVGVGLATMITGGLRAIYQNDLKLVLALGTVSQLGFLVALFGTGNDEIVFAASALLLAHAIYKAALFMIVGVIEHESGTRNLVKLSGLWRAMPSTAAFAVIAVASMVGIPLLYGFVAKEAVLEGLLHWNYGTAWVITATVVIGSALTAAYAIRFIWGAFASKRPGELQDNFVDTATVPAPSLAIILPAGILAVLTLAWGVLPTVVDNVVGGAAGALADGAEVFHLAAWHGFGTPLLLSVLSVALGFGVFAVTRRGFAVRLAERISRRSPNPTWAYVKGLRGLNRAADRTVAAMQPGSLPFYMGVILITVIVIPTLPLLGSSLHIDALEFAESPVQVAAVAALIISALGAALAQRRVGAVIFLGGAGYSVALLFVLQGAPDLALTQLLVETLTLAIFVLVLRLLPTRFDQVRWPLRRGLRMGVAISLGVFVTGMALIMRSARTVEPVSVAHVERALPDGGGNNIVNVILTDFRAFDTLGEITVLTVAALGILALARAARPSRPADDLAPSSTDAAEKAATE